MNRYLLRVRDAWSVLTGAKVAVEPATGGYVTFTGSTNSANLMPNGGFFISGMNDINWTRNRV